MGLLIQYCKEKKIEKLIVDLENVVIALPEDKIIIENVLYKPEIKAQIDIEKNPEGFVKYPHSQGGKYLFLASKTKEYFKSHFREIMIDV